MKNDPRLTTHDSRFTKMISSAPHSPGVYKMFDSGGLLLYVGKAKDLAKRLRQYVDIERLEYHKIIMRRQVAKVSWTVVQSESEALVLEHRLIKTERPKYNIVFKDDKSYPFLVLTAGDFPRLQRTRYKIHDLRLTTHDSRYGPFPFIKDMDETMKLVQKISQVRVCADAYMKSRKKPCILHQIGLCSAPCGKGKKDEYKKQVKMAKGILSGHTRRVISDLTQKMKAAAKEYDFESAAKFLGQIQSLQSTVNGARIVGNTVSRDLGRKK